ncbi:SMI1/KNR4 family protein [Enterococcus termitis]|uniref:SMI1 / KNR4 family protein n=1 Tax=Enterococcus termitis TaxID=332950 RepID=A0A1E5GJ84_9ENTE|nr:SMI1/KNR4 family protein [Enterococcus termitis]OEG12783.1 SMI1 / KNR4 family protein [Enterococcus termitis]OJG95597.1 SMI1 / KNR4 family protein [Enterococcus termitis]
MELIKIERFSNTTEEKIISLEQKYNLNLPKDYKEFLLNYNGGIVEKDSSNEISVEDIDEKIVIDVLYGIDTDNEKSNIDYWMDNLAEDLLENTVIIGDDLIQGLVLIICGGENEGVYYWDDSYHFENSDDEMNTYWIAHTFTEFMEMFGK